MNTKRSIISVGFIILGTMFLINVVPGIYQSLTSKKTESEKKPASNIYPFQSGDTCLTSQAVGAQSSRKRTVPDLPTDGKSDSTQAIQKTLDELGSSGGGIVMLPEGTFVLNGHIIMRNDVGLEGVGPKTVLKAGPNFLKSTEEIGYSIVSTKGANNVSIQHLTADHQGHVLDGNSINRFLGYVIHIHKSANVIVNDVHTRNPFTYSIVAEESTQFCIKNSSTQVTSKGKYDQLDGIHVLNSTFGDVLNNYVDQGIGDDGDDGLVAHTIDGTVHDITYAGNKVRGGKRGSGMQIALTNTTDTIFNLKIQNNEFWGSPRGIRTGYYGETGGSVHDVIIGGSEKNGNYIHDNIFGNTKVGDVVNIYGNGDDPYNITVSYNTSCNAGKISLGKGAHNIAEYNTDCSTH